MPDRGRAGGDPGAEAWPAGVARGQCLRGAEQPPRRSVPRSAWSGWSPTALNTAMTASPANRSMVAPSSSRPGTAAAQYVLSISIASPGAHLSAKLVNPSRSANRTVTSRSSPPSRASSGSCSSPTASPGETYGRKSSFDPPNLAGGPLEGRHLVAAHALPAQLLLDLVERLAGLERADQLPQRRAGVVSTCSSVPSRYSPPKAPATEAELRYAARAVQATSANPHAIRTCHSHHVRCQLRESPIATSASASSTHAAARRRGQRVVPAPVQLEVPPRGEAEERDPRRRERDQRPVQLALGRRSVERRKLREGDDRPDDEPGDHGGADRALVLDDPARRAPGERQRRACGEAAREHEPDRRGDHEADVPSLDERAWRRERVQPEEAGRDEERERDEERARVAPPPRRLARREPEHDVDERRREDQPEVARARAASARPPTGRRGEGRSRPAEARSETTATLTTCEPSRRPGARTGAAADAVATSRAASAARTGGSRRGGRTRARAGCRAAGSHGTPARRPAPSPRAPRRSRRP